MRDLPKLSADLAQPESAPRALYQITKRPDGRQPRLVQGRRRQRRGEAQPLLAIVVAVSKEVLGQKYTHLCPIRARQPDTREEQQPAKHEPRFQRTSPCPADVPQEETGARHDEQIGPGRRKGG